MNDDLLKEIINIVKWTEEGIKYNELEFSSKNTYQSLAYTIIKNKIYEAMKEGENGQSS